MGCLKKILYIVVLIFAYIGFQSVGGVKFCQDFISNFNKPNQEKSLLNITQILDTSKVSSDYRVSKSIGILGSKYIEIKYKKAPQKIFIIDSNNLIKISKKDFETGQIDYVLQNTISRFAYMAIRIENPRVLYRGKFNALEQTIPYVVFEADVIRGKIPRIKIMVATLQNKDGNNDLILSFSATGAYDQKITEKFFRQVRFKEVK